MYNKHLLALSLLLSVAGAYANEEQAQDNAQTEEASTATSIDEQVKEQVEDNQEANGPSYCAIQRCLALSLMLKHVESVDERINMARKFNNENCYNTLGNTSYSLDQIEKRRFLAAEHEAFGQKKQELLKEIKNQ